MMLPGLRCSILVGVSEISRASCPRDGQGSVIGSPRLLDLADFLFEHLLDLALGPEDGRDFHADAGRGLGAREALQGGQAEGLPGTAAGPEAGPGPWPRPPPRGRRRRPGWPGSRRGPRPYRADPARRCRRSPARPNASARLEEIAQSIVRQRLDVRPEPLLRVVLERPQLVRQFRPGRSA